jgi:hypothetical protein
MSAGWKQGRLRAIEGLLWLLLAALFVWRVTPPLRAAEFGAVLLEAVREAHAPSR